MADPEGVQWFRSNPLPARPAPFLNIQFFLDKLFRFHGIFKKNETPTHIPLYRGRVATKPVFGVSDKASFKPISSATETS